MFTVADQSNNPQSPIDVSEEITSAAQPNLSSEKQDIIEKELKNLPDRKFCSKELEKQKFEENTFEAGFELEEQVGLTHPKEQKWAMETEGAQGTETNIAQIGYDFFKHFWFGNEKQNKELKRDDNIENAVEATEDGQQMLDSDSDEEFESLAHRTESQQEDVHKFETKTSSNEDVGKELRMSNELWKVDGFIKKLRDYEKYFPTEVKKIVENILRRNTKSSEKIRTSDIRDELQKLDMKQTEETFDLVLMIRFATQIFWRSEKSQDERVSTNMDDFANCLKNAEHDLKKIRQEELQEISNKIKFLKSPIKIFKKSIKQQMKAMESEQLEILQNMYSIFQLETDPQSHEKLGHQKPKPKPLNELLKRRSSAEKKGTTTSDFKEQSYKITSTLTPSKDRELNRERALSKLATQKSSEENESQTTKSFIKPTETRNSVLSSTSTSTSTPIDHVTPATSPKVSLVHSFSEKQEQSREKSVTDQSIEDEKQMKIFDPEVERERKHFEMELKRVKRVYKDQEDQNRVIKFEKDKESNLEFQQELDREKQEDEETFRKLQEEIDEYERETQKILEENMEKWRACNDELVKCIHLQYRFEDAEHKWSNWLLTVKNSIDEAKNRFKLFEKIMRNINSSSSSYERIIMNELNSLHKSTLSAYGRTYEAWTRVKSIAEQQSDRIFLRILQKQFVMVCNKIYNCLLSIDYSMTDNQSLDGIIQSFQQLNTNEISTTGQLRNESIIAKWEDYSVIDKPYHYSKV